MEKEVSFGLQISIEDLYKIIGQKEVECQILKSKIAELIKKQTEKKNGA